MTEPLDVLEVIQGQLHDVRKSVAGIEQHLKELNGAVARNQEEIFGDSKKATKGLRPEVVELRETVIGVRAAAKTVAWIVTLVGIANIAALVTLLARLST